MWAGFWDRYGRRPKAYPQGRILPPPVGSQRPENYPVDSFSGERAAAQEDEGRRSPKSISCAVREALAPAVRARFIAEHRPQSGLYDNGELRAQPGKDG